MNKEKIVNVTTGEETYRNYTDAENDAVAAAQAEKAAINAEFEAKATARASALAKLAELGLTPDEVASL